MFELFDHTADVGVHVLAEDVDELFEEAGRSLFALIANDLGSIEPRQSAQFELVESDRELLLRDWLGELLYRFDTDRMLFNRFHVRIDEGRLTAQASGEPFDAGRHELGCEVKAVTYHDLTVRRCGEQWEARVIFDI